MPTVSVARGGAEPGASGSAWGAGEHTARMRRSVQRGWRRLGFRRQFLMLLVAATLLSTLGTVGAAYLGARIAAVSNAQSRIRRDVQVADQVVAAHGQVVTSRDGQLYTADGYRLNSDDSVVSQMSALTGDGTALYQLESGQLVGIAGNLTGGQAGTALLGQPLAGPAAQTLLAGCASARGACHVTYSGVVTLRGTSYIAGFAPLDDAQGHLAGALGVVTPLDAIDAPLRLLAGLLLLVGLLLTGVFIVVGYRISGPVSRRAFTTLSRGLDDVSAAAGRMEKMVRRQTARSEHQVAASQDLVAELRRLSDLAEALEHGTNLLRESTGQLWAEMSFPAPAAPGVPTGSAAMRQTAVAASQVGAAAGQARLLCHGLRTRLNQIIAEAGLLSSESQEADAYLESLGGAVLRVEEALGSQAASPTAGAAERSWRGLLARRAASAAKSRAQADDDADGDGGTTRAIRSQRTAQDADQPGQMPSNSTGRPAQTPRHLRSGHTNPHLGARSTGAYRAVPHPGTTSGPRATGSHPATSGRRRVPWYSDEQNLTGVFDEAPAHESPPSIPPTRQSGSWRTPTDGPASGPRPENWMNDLR